MKPKGSRFPKLKQEIMSKKALFYWFSFLFILLFITSCGTRKAQTSRTESKAALEQTTTDKKDVTVNDNSNVKVTNEVVYTDEITTTKKIYTPVDPTKLSVFTDDSGTKKELNNTSYTEEKTSIKTNKKSKTNTEVSNTTKRIDKGVKTDKEKGKTQEHIKNKHVERVITPYWLLWLILICLAVYAFWKYKNKFFGF